MSPFPTLKIMRADSSEKASATWQTGRFDYQEDDNLHDYRRVCHRREPSAAELSARESERLRFWNECCIEAAPDETNQMNYKSFILVTITR
jgi:hypothetical protein